MSERLFAEITAPKVGAKGCSETLAGR
jgi:hypothetical protein